MPKSQPEPEPSRCACGRDVTEAAATSYSASTGRYMFHRCECGAEWTQQLDHVDRSEPISTDEVLEVHVQLARFNGSIKEMLGLKTGS